VRADEPSELTQRPNWPPAPKDADFSLFVRAYWPQEKITSGQWTAGGTGRELIEPAKRALRTVPSRRHPAGVDCKGQGKCEQGWDWGREETFARKKNVAVIQQNQLTSDPVEQAT
jgi:hypothetical protein